MSNRVDAVIADPSNAPIDKLPWPRLTLASALIETANHENFAAIIEYVTRPEFSKELELYVVSYACKKDTTLLNTTAFEEWAKLRASELLA